MWVKCLEFALLLWIPAALHAQSSLQFCSAPTLRDGYFLPVKDSYAPQTQIAYSCDTGYKPAVEGWWATSTCMNAKWSPDPLCIEEASCLPPNIPNAQSPETPKIWYEDGETIEIKCNSGYVHAVMENKAAVCTRGAWSVPVCQRSPVSCSKPPYIPNMVVINQKQQETFAVRSQVEYQCKDGYVTEEGMTSKSICFDGKWTSPHMCRRHDNSGSQGGITKPALATIEHCGVPPEVPNSVRDDEEKTVTYTCVLFYKLVGSETVECYSDGSWSKAPTCKVDFCEINTAEHSDLINVGVKFVKTGETLQLECTDVWKYTNYAVVQCINGKLHRTRCCNRIQISTGLC